MISICLYFQVHQPYRIKQYSFFDIDKNRDYFDEQANSNIMKKVAAKCYLPANQTLLKLILQHHGNFKIAFSISGTAIEQFKLYSPETLESFKALAKTGCVEFINETYYHSLAFLKSVEEYKRQIKQHHDMIVEEFGQKPTTFRNTELIYNNAIAKVIYDLGYKVILTEGADKILGWRSPNFVYAPHELPDMRLLLKNYRLSDDIAFRFSNQGWTEFPLTAEKFASWLHNVSGNGETINLFMDYETFGEHQWAETGIFQFLNALPCAIFGSREFNKGNREFCFNTPSEVCQRYRAMSSLDVPYYISWADSERDLSAWVGNNLQDQALDMIYKLESIVYGSNDYNLIRTWQKLLTSDHFYYMCTKFFSDGDVHKYFNPFNSPYNAFLSYQNVVNDLANRLHKA